MTAIAAIPCSEPDECFFLFLSQPLRQNSFNLTFSPIIGEYYRVMGYLIHKKSNPYVAVLASSFIFGLIHILNGGFPNTTLFIQSFVFGGLLGVVYLKTRNLIYPMLIHFIFNLLMVLGGYV